MQTAVIVIPTYNEAGSIGEMLEYLFTKTLPAIKDYKMKVVVIDGNSPDGTADVVKKYVKKYPDLDFLLETKKEGIGAAYLKGFKYAIDKMGADFVFEMDGDFQHPPEAIPLALEAISQGNDYVIGSRKIPGGSNPKGWGFKRLFLSEIGSLTSRFIMFFPFKNFFKVTDPTTGFKVTRVKGFVDQMNLTDFSWVYTKSFAYKYQLLFNTLKMGARFAEIPLQFGLRTTGESKIEPQSAKDALRVVILIRWHDDFTQKFLKFGTVGFIGYLINASTLALFSSLWGVEWLAWLLSTELAIISNFTLNNLWTFKSSQISGALQLIVKFLQFNLTSAGALLIQTVFGTLGVWLLGPQYRQLLLPLIILFLVLPYNWLMYNRFIWRKK